MNTLLGILFFRNRIRIEYSVQPKLNRKVPMWDVVLCAVSHSELAGNVFASMDKDLSASNDEEEEEEEIESSEDQLPLELEPDPENASIVESEELASNLSENIDEASIAEDDNDANDVEADAADEADVGGVGSGDDHGESDAGSAANDDVTDNASDASGELVVCERCILSRS